MTVSFDAVHKSLCQRITRLDSAFDKHLFSMDKKKNVEKFAFQEGLLSALWQCWGTFSKQILFGSIRGAETINGQHLITPQYSNLTDYELFYAASVLSNQQPLTKQKAADPKNEPTWGDVQKLSTLFSAFNTPNAQKVSVIIGSSFLLKDLQSARNANAHIGGHTLSILNAAKVRYSNTSYRHPSDLIFWVEPKSKDYLWKSWIDEINVISALMVD